MMSDPNPIAFPLSAASPCVSVVIPTRNRPALVVNAVRSALAQSVPPLEVIVVIDGPEPGSDDMTVQALRDVEDVRMRVLPLACPVGGAEARNHGVRVAVGDWIAFLDDDDVWFQEKLAVQLAFAGKLPRGQMPILSCRVLARAPEWEEVWPRVIYRERQSVAEYLFCRRGWGYGEALLQTSTLLAPRRLLERVPFTAGLRKHQDWDWLLRASAEPDAAIYCVAEGPLVVFHVEGDRSSVSRAADWRSSLAWARQRRAMIPRRALRGFLVTECAAQAQRQSWRERAAVAGLLLRSGVPAPTELLKASAFLLVPQKLRRALRNLLRKLHTSR
jgi:glycosyltransferase involved in cell wall biosynthesis